MREIKFRAWHEKGFIAGFNMVAFNDYCGAIEPEIYRFDSRWKLSEVTIEQFTGKKCINGELLYEGDIVFVEDNSGICLIRDDDDPEEDVRYYMVIVWISEWCLFASLHIDEYKKYLKDGAESLDESMFWTYTIENSEVDFHYAGNIHQHPHLLEP